MSKQNTTDYRWEKVVKTGNISDVTPNFNFKATWRLTAIMYDGNKSLVNIELLQLTQKNRHAPQ